MVCNVANAKDLTGTKLICIWGYDVKSPFYDSYMAFDFISLDQLEIDFREYNNKSKVQVLSENLIDTDLINALEGDGVYENYIYCKLFLV